VNPNRVGLRKSNDDEFFKWTESYKVDTGLIGCVKVIVMLQENRMDKCLREVVKDS
jgi:hypothetical protein